MDPQMVWDMMEESDTDEEKRTTLCQSIEPELDKKSFKEKPAAKSSAGWMGFPVYGLNR